MNVLNDRRGFTLIEVMLGLAISAVIFALVLGAIRLANRSQEKGRDRLELTQRVRIVYDHLGWLLRGAYPYIEIDPEDPEERQLYFDGDSTSLGFVTTSTDPYGEGLADASGLKYVKMSLDEGLAIEENIFFMGGEDMPEESRYVLDPHVKEIEFTYFDPGVEPSEDGEPQGEPEPTWVEDWDGSDRDYLPLAVRIQIKLEFGEDEKWMPPVVASLRAAKSTGSVLPEGAPLATPLEAQPLEAPPMGAPGPPPGHEPMTPPGYHAP
jgi:prepilin-type N-terminal cleavage/methylation domain-containing protein